MKFSVVVPTYNRPKELGTFLDSLLSQKTLPQEVVLVDDGDLGREYIKKHESKLAKVGIDLVYYKKNHQKERRGLSESKNRAFDLASYDIIFFFDDDIIIDDPGYLTRIMKIWENNSDDNLIGVGGLIKGSRKKSKWEKLYNKIFGLSSKKFNWDVTEVGFQVWNEQITNPQKAFYMHGGVSSYNRKLARQILFPTFGGGRTGLEDVDFCLHAKNKGYYFYIEPRAKVIHNHVETSREKDFLVGQKESKNRRIIFKSRCKNNFSNILLFVWGNLGWVIRQFLARNFRKGLGMISGLIFK